MRPTFMGFETARKGLMVSQKSLDITGQNITNINTPGYTRQRVDQVSMTVSGQTSRYAISNNALAGQGVKVNGISQVRDSFLDKRFREEYGDVGYYDQCSTILADIEAALDEITSNGLKSAIAGLFTSLQNLTNNADQVTHANIVLTASRNLTQVLNQFDAKLNNIREQQMFDMDIAVGEVNSILERIAGLNESISKDMFLAGASTSEYYKPNELVDQRNLLLDELSRYVDMRAVDNADGTVTVEINGHTVVEGNKFETINMVRNSDKTVTMSWQSTGKSVNLTTGLLKAFTDMINGRGSDAKGANESFEQGIPYYIDKLDTFARVFAEVMNNAIPVVDNTGNFTGDKKQLFEGDANGIITAGNISVSSAWAAKPGYLITEVYTDGKLDNTHLLNLIAGFSEDRNFGEFTGTFEEYVNFYNTNLGQQKTFSDNRAENTAAIADELLDRRDAISGVSLDEEGTNLMLYEKAYQAASRLMTALDEALDVLINKTGLVGR